MTVTTAATILIKHSAASLVVPCMVFTESGRQAMSKSFQLNSEELGAKPLTATKYHTQTNGKVEPFEVSTVSRQRHYVAEHQQDWDKFEVLSV